MLGSILSATVKVATCPVTLIAAIEDKVAGGDGSKQSRQEDGIFGSLEYARDAVCESLEEIDK